MARAFGYSRRMTWRPDIFGYSDYRAYLRDFYAAAKANTTAFSYRYFARKAGFASPNFLKLVIDGERNLSADSVERFTAALGLDAGEATFFADLVALTQADNEPERVEAFERVAASRTFRDARRLDTAYDAYFSNWYIPVIREMTARDTFVEDPAWIGAQLLPQIPATQVAAALAVLDALGLVVRDATGRLRPADPTLTTGHELPRRSQAVANYHRQMLNRAIASIDLVPRERRDISALTVVVAPEQVAEMKRRVHAFRERMLDFAVRQGSDGAVYQLNVQLFPLTADPEATAEPRVRGA